MTLIFNLGLLTGIRGRSFTVAWEPYPWPHYWRSCLSSQLPLTAHKSSCYMSGCWRCPILFRWAECKNVTVVSFSAATVLCPALPSAPSFGSYILSCSSSVDVPWALEWVIETSSLWPLSVWLLPVPITLTTYESLQLPFPTAKGSFTHQSR